MAMFCLIFLENVLFLLDENCENSFGVDICRHLYIIRCPPKKVPRRVLPGPPWNGMKAVKRGRISAKNAPKTRQKRAKTRGKRRDPAPGKPPEAAFSARKPPCGSNYCKKREIYLADIQREWKKFEKK